MQRGWIDTLDRLAYLGLRRVKRPTDWLARRATSVARFPGHAVFGVIMNQHIISPDGVARKLVHGKIVDLALKYPMLDCHDGHDPAVPQ